MPVSGEQTDHYATLERVYLDGGCPMSENRKPVAIVQECAGPFCEFNGRIARAECVELGHSVGVDYVRALDLDMALAALAEIAAGRDGAGLPVVPAVTARAALRQLGAEMTA